MSERRRGEGRIGYGEALDSKPENETASERDARMEAWYTKPAGDADMSILAIVDRDRLSLAAEFWRWRAENPGGPLDDGLRRFEVSRFWAQLYPAVHGVLLFAVTHGEVVTPGPRRPALSGSERQRRFDEAAGRKAREMAWPKGNPDVAKLTDQRNAELQQQKAEIEDSE